MQKKSNRFRSHRSTKSLLGSRFLGFHETRCMTSQKWLTGLQQKGMFLKSVIILNIARERRSEILWKKKKIIRLENTENLANASFSSIHSDLTHDEKQWKKFPSFPRFCEGLKMLGLMEAVIQHPEVFRSTFCFEPKKLCSTNMTKLFKICRSERELIDLTGKQRLSLSGTIFLEM